MQPALRQHGRAGLQFMAAVSAVASGNARKVVAAAEARAGVGGDGEESGYGSGEQRLAAARRLAGELAGKPPYAWWSFLNRWGSAGQAPVAVDAFEEVRAEVEPELERSEPAWGTLEIPDGFSQPPGYEGYEFHLTRGGWDGHPHMGFVHHEIVYPFVFEHALRRRPGGGDVHAHKRIVAAMAPRDRYRRILDLGTGTGRFLEAVGEVYEEAELHAVDLSPTLLRYGHHRAGEIGKVWHLRAAGSDATGYPDGWFDLVTVFVLFHEVPVRVIESTLREAFRVLEPGGDLLIADVVPYRHLDPVRVMISDWETENRNEPFWRTHGLTDLPAVLESVGYSGVKEVAGGPAPFFYPWVTMARKPGVGASATAGGEATSTGAGS